MPNNTNEILLAIYSGNRDTAVWLRQIALGIDNLREESKQQKSKIQAIVSIQELNRKQELYERTGKRTRQVTVKGYKRKVINGQKDYLSIRP